jgi:hypothetical protein
MAKKYINNIDLYCEIVVSKEMGKLTKEAQSMLYVLGKNIIRKFRYKDDDDRLDCLQTGLLDMYANWYNFDENKSSNAFSYFTEVFKRGTARGWNQLHKRKGDDLGLIKTISLEGFSSDGERFERY